ncbi:MAG: radical SAM family heme chaperone HemW [Bacteroidales bacterium]|nr:radical SAM family heme chaperone HemW [Bacteroidales bacterium]MBN2758619.1 radical SAM family heme chaperone HemW [Bacteroidales bacterium]
MAGIYIHIPFCKKICHYCDFYKTANLKLEDDFINSVIKEIEIRSDFLDSEIETIYFGGGTPSAISINNLQIILNNILQKFSVNKNSEITIELNPDDINEEYLNQLLKLGFNRLSIGTQSFNNQILNYLNRRHNSEKAENSIKLALNVGYKNISVDLIYGIPNQTEQNLLDDISIISKYDVSHISAYHLTIEKNTYFGKLLKKGLLKQILDEKSFNFYKLVVNELQQLGFEQYEISNFARNSDYSKHNTNYWKNVAYLGLGPSAHSYNNKSRFWNYTPLTKYIEGINVSKFYEQEELSLNNLYNEFIMVSLRTKWGINLQHILIEFGQMYYENTIRIYLENKNTNYIRRENDTIKLSTEGLFLSDFIIQEFFIIN